MGEDGEEQTDLRKEHELLQRWVDSAEASQEYMDFPVEPDMIYDARLRLGRLKKLIDGLDRA